MEEYPFFNPVSSSLFLTLVRTVGKVIAATTPIMPKVIKTSARVNAHFLSNGGKFLSKLENLKFCFGFEFEKLASERVENGFKLLIKYPQKWVKLAQKPPPPLAES